MWVRQEEFENKIVEHKRSDRPKNLINSNNKTALAEPTVTYTHFLNINHTEITG